MRPMEPGQAAQGAEAAMASLSPSQESWTLFLNQFGQLLQSIEHLTSIVLEVGAQSRALINLFERDQPISIIAPPASFESGAILPTGAMHQLGAIVSRDATQQPGAIYSATPQPGAIFSATPQPAAIFSATPHLAAIVDATQQSGPVTRSTPGATRSTSIAAPLRGSTTACTCTTAEVCAPRESEKHRRLSVSTSGGDAFCHCTLSRVWKSAG
ncbi:unnamed protein product [Lampetra fluviatilis]